MRPIYRSYQKMQQFTADAAHELRPPLATIRAIVESTRDVAPLTEAEAKEALFRIRVLGLRSQTGTIFLITFTVIIIAPHDSFTSITPSSLH